MGYNLGSSSGQLVQLRIADRLRRAVENFVDSIDPELHARTFLSCRRRRHEYFGSRLVHFVNTVIEGCYLSLSRVRLATSAETRN